MIDMFAKEVLHYPRLDTVLMVEETIKNCNNYYTRTELWKKLPRKVQYQTFKIIIDYLINSGKIMIDEKDGKVVWTYNPELVKKVLKKNLVIR